MKTRAINIPVLGLSILIMALLLSVSLFLVKIDTDITGYLPGNDPVISDAARFFRDNPIQDRMMIDITLGRKDTDALARYATLVEREMKKSGLFKTVGTGDMAGLFPDLISHILDNLPLMFTERDLQEKVAPLLTGDKIDTRFQSLASKLMGLEGIGQAELISRDPLGLKDLVLARLSDLLPVKGPRLHGGRIFSADDRHLLLIATPLLPGANTAFARKLAALMDRLSRQLREKGSAAGDRLTITPMGAYRAALDNELLIRRDVQRAILLTTAGIALLLIFAFPRPLLGLFAFLPALAGTVTAFFVFSILFRSVSIMTLGFGGAVISITVDHAIAFLLFLDRPQRTSGREASREIWAVGLLAALTTMGAFGALYFCGFPVFEQIGIFTALGILFSFLFVHFVFPAVFPSMPPARPRSLPLRTFVSRISSLGKGGAFGALIFGLGMTFFAWPRFNVELSAMNTVSPETAAAERLLGEVWGNKIFQKSYVMTEGKDLEELQRKGDRLSGLVDRDLATGVLSAGFTPSTIFPGKERRKKNLEAWKRFWNRDRVTALKGNMARASREAGFTENAFEPFFETVSVELFRQDAAAIPSEFLELLGISRQRDDTGWVQVASLTPGRSYDPNGFYIRYRSLGKVFDPTFFSIKMGDLLFSTFSKILMTVGGCVILLLFMFFLDLKLTALSLLPLLFALISTLGTLNIMDHPLDIPGLMLSIVVVGMGVDYSIFLVRSFQRYGNDSHPSHELVRTAVFLASASTIIGFGALCFARHSLLRSAGLTSLLGIGYSLMGAFLILPPLLTHFFRPQKGRGRRPANIRARVLEHYGRLEPYPRLFARFKLMIDPMFRELPGLLESFAAPKTIVDLGTGYGVPACWFLERFPDARIYGIEPDPERVRVASLAAGKRGVISHGRAPEIPRAPDHADLALMLDMSHFLTDPELALTLKRLRSALTHGGGLIIRAVIPPGTDPSLLWRINTLIQKFTGKMYRYRSVNETEAMITAAGFRLEISRPSGSSRESVWFLAKAME